MRDSKQAPERLLDPDRFPRGSRVRKFKGYKFEGVVLGTFRYKDTETKFVNVQHDDGWVMHFRETDLEFAHSSGEVG